jgi:hypothetical protein
LTPPDVFRKSLFPLDKVPLNDAEQHHRCERGQSVAVANSRAGTLASLSSGVKRDGVLRWSITTQKETKKQ